MKKTTSLQELFDDLPISLLQEDMIETEAVDEDAVARVWAATQKACRMAPAKKSVRMRKRVWLIPAVAALLVAAMITGVALSAHVFTPQYSYPVPAIKTQSYMPMVTEYENAVQVNETVEHDNLRVTLNCFSADPLTSTLRMSVLAETVDESPLTELSGERLSMVGRTGFEFVTLYVDGEAVRLKAKESGTALGLVMRADNAGDPTSVLLEIVYTAIGPNKDLTGKDYVLELTNLKDVVRTVEDLGFTYESMKALYDDMQPAGSEDFVQGMRAGTVGETEEPIYYYALPDGDQKIRFSTVLSDAYIDNIAFREEPLTEEKSLYVSYAGLSEEGSWPFLIDMRTGGISSYSLVSYDENGKLQYGLNDMEQAQMMGIADDNKRVTLCYEDVSEEDLPYLFMMWKAEEETVIRVEGTWEIPFTVGSKENLPVHTFVINEELAWAEYRMHATHISISDEVFYMTGTYEILPVEEGETSYASIYGNIDLLMADGTVIEEALWQGGSARLQSTDEFEYGGTLRQYIDSTQVVGVVMFDKTVMLSD